MKPLLYSQRKTANYNNVLSDDSPCLFNKAFHSVLYFSCFHMFSQALLWVWLRMSSVPFDTRVITEDHACFTEISQFTLPLVWYHSPAVGTLVLIHRSQGTVESC